MAFGNYQNNDKKTKSKNTKGYQFYNQEAYGSTLVLGYWNSTLTMKIHPMLPENKRTDNLVYDYESFVNVALTPQRVFELYSGLKNIAISVANGIYSFKSVGVPAGAGFIEVAPASKFGSEVDAIVVCIYNGIDENGKPTDRLIYQFKKGSYFENYDPDNGAYDKSNDIEIEYLMFYKMVEEQVAASTNAIAHSIRHANMYSDEAISNSFKSIKEKLGIEATSSGGYNRGGNTTSYFGANKRDNESSNTNYGSIDNGGVVREDRLPGI